jgi:CheY-like chemotaxis protein
LQDDPEISCMGARVLVIDDNPGIRETLGLFLETLGYEVEEAANGVEGLRRVGPGRYDLVLTDVLMPGMTGWEVADAIRAAAPATGVVLISGLASHEVVEYAEARGLPVLMKPFSVDQLHRTLVQALGSA